MTDIKIVISQAVDGYNTHHDTNIDEYDLLDPVISQYSSFASFDALLAEAGLNEDYEGMKLSKFDGLIQRAIGHVKVSDLHSLLTLAMNEYSEG